MAPGPMAAMTGYTDIGSSGTFCAWCVAVPASYCRFLLSQESWCSIWRNDGVSRYELGLLIITREWFYSFILYFPWFNRYIRTWFFSDISSALSRLYSQCRIDKLNPILFSALLSSAVTSGCSRRHMDRRPTLLVTEDKAPLPDFTAYSSILTHHLLPLLPLSPSTSYSYNCLEYILKTFEELLEPLYLIIHHCLCQMMNVWKGWREPSVSYSLPLSSSSLPSSACVLSSCHLIQSTWKTSLKLSLG